MVSAHMHNNHSPIAAELSLAETLTAGIATLEISAL